MNELEITRQFVEKITSTYKEYLSSITLFGSWAKGTQGPHSDIDLLVVMEAKERSVIDQIYQEVLEILLKYELDISLKIYSLKQFNRLLELGTPFITSIEKTGVKLWNKA
ncbi:MAG: nucleotidyltransferase domain-containing protein [Candidatus Tectomicrobia bacterium]|uniref:Nucleotidyltransferase domain-containing protein n=1 Tax=Tectimicrobiota bacterium TaxID=2528274 RepID=A0A933GKE0_UNCTE|nr:nucleotidyltransferase domain-containing protein [Candidatus Tectomicrobia bacterium]